MKIGGNTDIVDAIERLIDKQEATENSIDALYELVDDIRSSSEVSQEIIIEVGGEIATHTIKTYKELRDLRKIFEDISADIREQLSKQDKLTLDDYI